MKHDKNSSFLESVNRMFDRAISVIDLPPGLADQIRGCASVYQVRFMSSSFQSERLRLSILRKGEHQEKVITLPPMHLQWGPL